MTILSIHPGILDPFALKLKESDSLTTLKQRIGNKLLIPSQDNSTPAAPPADVEHLLLKYLHAEVLYPIRDQDDWDAFVERQSHHKEVYINVEGAGIPTTQPAYRPQSLYTPSIYGSRIPGTDGAAPQPQSQSQSQPTTNTTSGNNNGPVNAHGQPLGPSHPHQHHHHHDASTGAVTGFSTGLSPSSSSVYGGGAKKSGGGGGGGGGVGGHSIHLIGSSSDAGSVAGMTVTTTREKKPKSIAGTNATGNSVPQHKVAFDEFHQQNGVRTVVGSIGPIENVRMMIKNGHRACYMSRKFAQDHGFIPKDAAPGFYGFSGITNLGSWPIKVGSKTVELQVMLIESAYFPVILGRSFMEKRGVRTDPLDQTSVIFMDTGEHIPIDVVVVKDSEGQPVPIP